MQIYVNSHDEIIISHRDIIITNSLINFSNIDEIINYINNRTYSYLINHRGDQSILNWISDLLKLKNSVRNSIFSRLIPIIDTNIYLLRRLFQFASEAKIAVTEFPLFISVCLKIISLCEEYVDLSNEDQYIIDSLVVKGFLIRMRLTESMFYTLSDSGKILFKEFSKSII